MTNKKATAKKKGPGWEPQPFTDRAGRDSSSASNKGKGGGAGGPGWQAQPFTDPKERKAASGTWKGTQGGPTGQYRPFTDPKARDAASGAWTGRKEGPSGYQVPPFTDPGVRDNSWVNDVGGTGGNNEGGTSSSYTDGPRESPFEKMKGMFEKMKDAAGSKVSAGETEDAEVEVISSCGMQAVKTKVRKQDSGLEQNVMSGGQFCGGGGRSGGNKR